jgi:hypothetical protein
MAKSNKDNPKPKSIRRPWLFTSLEGNRESHVLSGTETTDNKGKKHITLKKTKPGNSSN